MAVEGCVDLSLLTRTMDNPNWGGSYTTQIGLAELVAYYAGRELQKGLVRLSNWEAKPLSLEQEECNVVVIHSVYSSTDPNVRCCKRCARRSIPLLLPRAFAVVPLARASAERMLYVRRDWR